MTGREWNPEGILERTGEGVKDTRKALVVRETFQRI